MQQEPLWSQASRLQLVRKASRRIDNPEFYSESSRQVRILLEGLHYPDLR